MGTTLPALKPLTTKSFQLALLLALHAAASGSLRSAPVISEVMAANRATIADEDGAYSDWIEIHNSEGAAIDLTGWYLTDSASNKRKWQFPSITLPGGGYLLVYASSKNRRDPAGPLHTNFALSADGEYLALVQADGSTVAFEYSPGFPALAEDTAWGLPSTATGVGGATVLRTPTPGQPNTAAAPGRLTETVTYSQPAGPFRASFSLHLSGAAGDQKIRYVIVPAGSAATGIEPTESSPEYVTPIMVDRSVLVRAAVFSADGQARGEVSVAYYPKLAPSLASFSSKLPVLILDHLGAGPLVKDNVDHPTWLFSYPSQGTIQPVFVREPDLASPLASTVRGSSSADFPKKGYNLKFEDETGKGRSQALLDLPGHEKWALVAPWSFDLTYINNAFVYALSNQMGRWAPRTRLVEVFVNSDGGDVDLADYAGIFVVTDRVEIGHERVDLKEMGKSDAAGDAVTGGYILKLDVKDADEVGWTTRRNIPEQGYNSVVLVSPKADDVAPAQLTYIQNYVQEMEDALAADRATGFVRRTYLDYIDRDSWIDHHLINTFVCNPDALVRSAYFTKDRNGRLKAGPVWDFDRAINSHWDARSQRWDVWYGLGANDPWDTGWWSLIARDPEFMQDWIDRWQSLRRGPLENEHLSTIVDHYANQIGNEAAQRDATRWPDSVSPWGNHAAQIDQMKRWLHNRTRWIDEQFVAAPGMVVSGGSVTFTPPAGARLVYTLDGSDPRSLGGGIAPNAQHSAGPLTVPASANAHVRSYREDFKNAFPGSPWSSAASPDGASPLSPRSRIVNLSSRAIVGTGEDALIAGIVVADTSSKRYLARAVGPGLAAFGASDVLPDPQLSLFSGNGVELLRNVGWETGPHALQLPRYAQAVGAFPLAPGSRDSAAADVFATGTYTIQITSAAGQTGTALAELYELDHHGRIANLSTRARVRAGDGVLIGGFVVEGAAYKRMLIRAVGPTLSTLGVGNALSDPVLTVHAGPTAIATNDRWSSGNVAALNSASQGVGAFQLAAGSEDAALLLSLPPGGYTVEVKGKDNGEGIVLLEIYDVP